MPDPSTLTGGYVCFGDHCPVISVSATWTSREEDRPLDLRCPNCNGLMMFAGYDLGELLDDAER